MIGARGLAVSVLILYSAGPLLAAADEAKPSGPATHAAPGLVLEGRLKHPLSLDLEALRRLPAEHAEVSFQSERGATTASYTGVRLWEVLAAAGGIDDDEKGAALRHVVKITGRDGYLVVISTGEIAPDFGDKPALIAYQHDGEPPGEAGLRLVMPGDKRGGRNVRDVVAIRVE
jgi:DMSO/TMAO reductase YedYZ molybdopterin-dependent catalytic subunit